MIDAMMHNAYILYVTSNGNRRVLPVVVQQHVFFNVCTCAGNKSVHSTGLFNVCTFDTLYDQWIILSLYYASSHQWMSSLTSERLPLTK